MCNQEILTKHKALYLTYIYLSTNDIKLLKRPDWKDWEASGKLQLDQYDRQKMFDKPGPIPSSIINYSILQMIRVYIIKVDRRKEARCVDNGAPHLKGTITSANTYAACLEQAASCLFSQLQQ